MSRRQLFILCVIASPMVAVFALPSAISVVMRDWAGPLPTVLSGPGDAGIAAHDVDQDRFLRTDRVALLSSQSFDITTGDRRSDSFPDAALIDHYGRTVKFRSDLIRDKICCIVFFYTNCEGTCPGTLQRVAQLRRSLKNEFASEQLQFIAITLDPEFDTVERLRDYAVAVLADSPDGFADWRFCTGDVQSIEEIRRSLGLYELDPELDADRSQHAALITFGNDNTDRWTALPAGTTFNDFEETFLRIAGTSEQQRFATRIARSALMNSLKYAASANEFATGHSAKESCSLPNGDKLQP